MQQFLKVQNSDNPWNFLLAKTDLTLIKFRGNVKLISNMKVRFRLLHLYHHNNHNQHVGIRINFSYHSRNYMEWICRIFKQTKHFGKHAFYTNLTFKTKLKLSINIFGTQIILSDFLNFLVQGDYKQYFFINMNCSVNRVFCKL